MKLDANGINEYGVAMCECGNKQIHAWEPGEWCSPERVVPEQVGGGAVNGAELIAAERARHGADEGGFSNRYTASHDDEHSQGELAFAAATYAIPTDEFEVRFGFKARLLFHRTVLWPFSWGFRPKRKDRIRELVKAGALIAAEIDRLQRAEQVGGGDGGK